MPPKTSTTRAKGKSKATERLVPDIYQQMLAEALPQQTDIAERPLKKRRIGPKEPSAKISSSKPIEPEEKEPEDDDLQFEDVFDVAQIETSTTQQTIYRDSEDESDVSGSDHDWEAIDFGAKLNAEEPSADLELTLTKKSVSQGKAPIQRRRAVTKDERVVRLQIHKMHVLCLLSHLDRKNNWCNDSEVQRTLKRLLDKKIIKFLTPSTDLTQFQRMNSLKRGLEDISLLWRKNYKVTARGMRRALWAENEKDLENYKPLDDAESIFDRADFREAARSLKGSRDLGAQLFCALLRSAGVETRLVCSLQPLSFNAGGPAMPRASSKRPAKDITREVTERGQEVASPSSFEFGTASSASMAPRNRLGHPNAADYHIPEISSAPRPSPIPKAKPIIESPYPIFWVEVFDSSRQKWNPVDPLVTETISRPYSFEPPANDRENSLSYVIAFEEDGIAKDVTRRYSKAYNAKLRKNRVECTPHGDRWWRKAMRPYRRGFTNDADQIEDSELAACEAREPMPKNVLDFKDHPYYALERHLKRNEVLISTRECGKVAAGRDASKPGGKKLESVYRRKDVRVARSADKWYRLGRDVKLGEVPVKTVEPKKRVDDEEGDDDRAGTNLYVEEQTELYVAPPVVNGRIPRNSFGNLDVFVPSMVPKGGVHIMSNEAVMAARLLGIDYAPALTGFEFRGRHGTAVLSGAVVAEECREAVEAVIEGMRDEQARVEEEMRALRALKFWKRFLVGLRIKERVDGYAVEGEDEEAKHGPEHANDKSEMEIRDGSEDSDEYVDDGGGGFFPE